MAVLQPDMSQEDTPPSTQTVRLARGAQVVINGALVSASESCTLEVGSGAYVLTGRALWPVRSSLRNPQDELYFSLLDCSADTERFTSERFRLFGLLGEVVAQDRTHEGQRECAQCAAALLGGDKDAAVESAARMAANGLRRGRTRTKVPGARAEKRRAVSAGE
ncbi:MAG: hypothetical protein AAGA34_02250 [Pseudomonadota bacterium]